MDYEMEANEQVTNPPENVDVEEKLPNETEEVKEDQMKTSEEENKAPASDNIGGKENHAKPAEKKYESIFKSVNNTLRLTRQFLFFFSLSACDHKWYREVG